MNLAVNIYLHIVLNLVIEYEYDWSWVTEPLEVSVHYIRNKTKNIMEFPNVMLNLYNCLITFYVNIYRCIESLSYRMNGLG